MVIENPIPPFAEWFPAALVDWVLVLGILSLVVLFVCLVAATVRHGPMRGAERVYLALEGLVLDVVRFSPRRTLALAWLAFQEAIRRRVLIGIGLFMVVLLFAGWFVDPSAANDKAYNPASVYISIVLGTTSLLISLQALYLAVFSLPNDITRRTIYTVVTKPVRPNEIVIGRILGFTAVGTLTLAAMGGISYLFVTRGLDHTHQVLEQNLAEVPPAPGDPNPLVKKGLTSRVKGHQHQVFIRQDGTGETDIRQGHWHQVTSEKVQGKTVYTLGPPLGLLSARVPVYAPIRYRSRDGHETDAGENVGDVWTYRQFVEGGTQAAAIWRFSGITEEKFPKGLPLHLTIEVFRSHKGRQDQPVAGDLSLRNPKTGLASQRINFASREFQGVDEHFLTRQQQDRKNNPIDLFRDLVADGQVDVELSCLDSGQYFGAAPYDAYLLSREAAFRPNFFKGYVGIWLQMVLITTIGVVFSTFLNGPVSMLAAKFALAVGLLRPQIEAIIQGDSPGGQAFESLYRMVTHAPVVTDLEPGVGREVLFGLDKVVHLLMNSVVMLLPDLGRLSDASYVAHGFDIPVNNLLVHGTTALAYLVPLVVAGYFLLKTREMAK